MCYKVEYLIAIRESLGLNAGDFAKKLGYTNIQSYKNIEAGHDPISGVLVKRLQLMGVNSEFLKNGQGEIFAGVDIKTNIPILSQGITDDVNPIYKSLCEELIKSQAKTIELLEEKNKRLVDIHKRGCL